MSDNFDPWWTRRARSERNARGSLAKVMFVLVLMGVMDLALLVGVVIAAFG